MFTYNPLIMQIINLNCQSSLLNIKKVISLFINLSLLIISATSYAQPSINTKLDTLYLENYPGHPQLQNLLQKSSVHEKLILQFYHTDKEKLTLAIWPSRHKNQENDKNKMEILQNWNTSTNVDNDFAGKNIFLGDQQIYNSSDLKKLNDLVNNPEAKYIFFIPKIENDHIKYDLGYAPGLSFQKKFTPLTITTDPSPPAKAY